MSKKPVNGISEYFLPAKDPVDIDESSYGVEPNSKPDVECSSESVTVPETERVLTETQLRELKDLVPNHSDGNLHKALLVYIDALKFVISKYHM